MRTTIILTINHKKPVPDLLDKVADRAYKISGVDDVAANILQMGGDVLCSSSTGKGEDITAANRIREMMEE